MLHWAYSNLAALEVEALANAVTIFARLALKEAIAESGTTVGLQFLLDKSDAIHLLPKFGGKEPLRMDVTVAATERSGHFDVDLDYMRARLNQSWGQWQLVYDLRIEGARLDGSKLVWIIPAARIPAGPSLSLSPTSLPEYQV